MCASVSCWLTISFLTKYFDGKGILGYFALRGIMMMTLMCRWFHCGDSEDFTVGITFLLALGVGRCENWVLFLFFFRNSLFIQTQSADLNDVPIMVPDFDLKSEMIMGVGNGISPIPTSRRNLPWLLVTKLLKSESGESLLIKTNQHNKLFKITASDYPH